MCARRMAASYRPLIFGPKRDRSAFTGFNRFRAVLRLRDLVRTTIDVEREADSKARSDDLKRQHGGRCHALAESTAAHRFPAPAIVSALFVPFENRTRHRLCATTP